MLATEIQQLDLAARRRFTYRRDRADRDEWRSHADQVLAGEYWAGDCDDLASTVLDLAGRDGAPLALRFRLLADASPPSGRFNHMVAAIQDEAGRFWIVGDTFAPAHTAEGFLHRPFAYHRLDEYRDGDPLWRDGAPWQQA